MKQETDFTEEDVELSLKNYLHENGWDGIEIGTGARAGSPAAIKAHAHAHAHAHARACAPLESFDYTTWMNLQDVLFWAAECFIRLQLEESCCDMSPREIERNTVRWSTVAKTAWLCRGRADMNG